MFCDVLLIITVCCLETSGLLSISDLQIQSNFWESSFVLIFYFISVSIASLTFHAWYRSSSAIIRLA